MFINHLSESIRYTGRWNVDESAATTTAVASTIELAFEGKSCDLHFDVQFNYPPYPHIWIQVDSGVKVETAIGSYLRIETPEDGNHIIKIIFKSVMEDQQRWYIWLNAKLTFLGADVEKEGVLPEDNRKVIEFIGDSITEGTWVDEYKMPCGDLSNHANMVYQNDSTATYAYLTAEKLGMKPYIMGYGAVGLTKSGGGCVPKVYESYPYNYWNSERKPSNADIIVINHGANDFAATEEMYISAYRDFLKLVRSINPGAQIVVLSAFVGRYNFALKKMVEQFNKNENETVIFIDTSGWIPAKPIHPTREGHEVIASKLSEILKEKIKF